MDANPKGSSPSHLLQEQAQHYLSCGLVHDPPSLAMPVPRLGYQPEFDFLVPLLPSTPFFALPSQTSPEPSSHQISQPFHNHSGTVIFPSFDTSSHATPLFSSSALETSPSFHHGAPLNSHVYPPTPCMPPQVSPANGCDLFSHTIPLMASEQVNMAMNDFQLPTPAPSQLVLPAADQQQEPKNLNHSCHICGRGFKKTASLSQHYMSHEGIRPFGCNFHGCNKRFTTSSNAKRHAKTHLT